MRNRAFLILVLLAGCGGARGSAFTETFPDNRESDVSAALGRLTAGGEQPPVAVAVAADPPRLYAVDLRSGQKRWEVPAEPASMPHIAGDLVITREARGVVGRSLADGRQELSFDDRALHLVGADGEGELAAIVLSTGGGVEARSLLVVVNGGSVSWTREVSYALGAPAVRGGLVFVPWASQNVSVLDARSGDELARVRITDSVIGHAFTRDGQVYVGQQGVFRFTPAITSGTRVTAPFFEPAFDRLGELPGRPPLMWDAYAPPPPPDNALHRVRLEWEPTGGGAEVTLADNNLYVVYYKLVFAVDPSGDGARWVYESDADIVGARATDGGIYVVDADGRILWLGAEDGRVRSTIETGLPTVVASLRASAGAGGAPQGESLPLRDQLLSAAQSTDARLVAARAYAVSLLGRLPEPEVTGNLIALCDDRTLPRELHASACAALGARQSGAEHVLAALDRRAAFLQGTTAPPVAALARAAVNLQARQAAPLLVQHLRDPETPVEDLAPLLVALKELGDNSTAEPIRDFLLLYHADSEEEPMIAALTAAADALVGLTGPVAGELIEQLIADPFTVAGIRTALQEDLDGIHAEEGVAEETPPGEETPSGEETPPEEELPDHIDAAIVGRVLGPVARELGQCLMTGEGRPRNARIIIVLEGDGTITTVSVVPDSVQGCIEPLVRAQTFPGNRRRARQQVTHVVRR